LCRKAGIRLEISDAVYLALAPAHATTLRPRCPTEYRVLMMKHWRLHSDERRFLPNVSPRSPDLSKHRT
jgi:hypothetical protein